ncbi:Dihydrofolate reductase [Popillia japonica]|uniref:dihydrofolate reductase n=1 Tax=Popillia japonica TaxID=7064 RepID=A0AAW1JZB9_POPJA
MALKLNLIAAVCENMGMGKNNNLPWRLKTEMAYFTEMTSRTLSDKKQNVVIMGRKTWDSIPSKFKPLPNRINFVLSRSDLDLNQYKDTYAFKSFDEMIDKLNNEKFQEAYEKIWVIGGSHIYKMCLDNKYFHRLYLTEIKKTYDCDIFFPQLGDKFVEVEDSEIPKGIQQENDVQFVYKVFETKK